MQGKIILEEAWNLPRLSNAAVNYASPEGAIKLERDMQDIKGRIAEMDQTGIELQVLSFTSPGAQGVYDRKEAEALATEANNWIANECKSHPGRFANFAAVSMHDAHQAAAEARRCITELGFVGVMLNDYQSVADDQAPEWAERGDDGMRLYFDHPGYDVLWEAMAELGYPVYMHPRLHSGEFYKKRPWLAASAHGFKTQLASHVLALATSGVFDRFPKLQLIIGHLGEGIPFDLWRLDHKLDRARFPAMPMSKKKLIRDYFTHNIHITSSGHFSTRALMGAIAELGADRIMFSIDFPYESDLANGATWFDNVPIAEADRLKIGRTNAVKLLKLDQALFNITKDKTMEELRLGGLDSHVFGIGTH